MASSRLSRRKSGSMVRFPKLSGAVGCDPRTINVLEPAATVPQFLTEILMVDMGELLSMSISSTETTSRSGRAGREANLWDVCG